MSGRAACPRCVQLLEVEMHRRNQDKEIPIANAAEAQWHGGRFRQRGAGLYRMWFGQVGTHEVYVWADNFDSAFEEAVEYLDDKGFCGFFTTIDESDFKDAAESLGLDEVTFK